MNSIPFMPLYANDYLVDTAHLTTAGHGAYLLLILNYWQSGKPLPDNDRKLSRIARMNGREWNRVREDIREFFLSEDGFLRHPRIDNELEKARIKVEQAIEAGKRSAQRRQRESLQTTPAPVEQELSSPPSEDERQLNERSTPVEQALNYRDRDRDRDREINITHAPYYPPKGVCERAQAEPCEPDELFIAIRKAFLSKNPTGFVNAEREISAIWRLRELAIRAGPSEPEAMTLMGRAMSRFWELTTSQDKFWSKHPFLPSRLVSFWADVLKLVSNEEKKSEASDYSWLDV